MRIYVRNFFIYQNSKHEETTLFKGKVAVITVKRKQFKWGWKFAIDPVHQVVNSLHSSLAGESPFLSQEAQPKQVFTSTSSPIDAWILAKLKTKIWEETYIDFRSLLTSPAREGQYQLSIDNSGKGSSPSLAIELVNPPKKIVSIDTWVEAFHVFYKPLWQWNTGLMK